MTEASFQRARKPEQIEARREAILAAAAELFDAEGPEGAGLNAIAARAGFTKSNVYRYFESREAVLLSLLVDELRAFTNSVEASLSQVEPGDVAAVARFSAAAFLVRPRFGRLLSILATTLEHNVSEQAVIELKRESLGLMYRMAGAISRALPALGEADCAWATSAIGTYVAGLWPSAHPNPLVEKVLAMPEFSGLKPRAEIDLERMIFVLLSGLTAGVPGPASSRQEDPTGSSESQNNPHP
ncbi:MAG TPA: TetR family transcriptional regulator [Devosiaceae bacterium]|nr:TetR family transcriptional regulator [Devosiaceae bacterium]